MEIFEITIQHRLDSGWPVVAEHSRPDEMARRSEGTLVLGDQFEDDLRALTLQRREYG